MKKKFYANGGLLDYYKTQLNQDQQLASGILGTVGGLVGNVAAPGVGGAIGSQLGSMAGNLFAGGGNMITEIPGTAGTHEQNPNEGVNINNYGSSVEGNETIDNKNKFVFSNRLKPNGSKKSYADLTKPLNKKLELRPQDKLTKEYVQTEMDKLAEDQEAQKAYLDIMDQAEMLYGGMMEMKKGGFMGINPAHKGYCTPMTKSTCTPRRKALARTLKKHHGFHKKDFGGDLGLGKDTLVGGKNMRYLNPQEFQQATLPKDSFLTPNVLLPQGQTGNIVKPMPNIQLPTVPNYNVPSYSKPYAPLPNPNTLAKGGSLRDFFKKKPKANPYQAEIDKYKSEHPEELDEQGNFKVAEDQRVLLGTNPKGNFNKPLPIDRTQPMELMAPIGTPTNNVAQRNIRQAPNLLPLPEEEGLTKPITAGATKGKRSLAPFSQLLGPASQMLTSLAQRNNDLANLNYRTPEFTPIDETYAANLARQTQDQQSAQIGNAIRGTANDPGSYLAAMLSANSGLLSQGSQPANIAYQANVANTAGRNQNAQLKAGIQNQNIDEREKLLDNSREEFTNSLYNAGIPITGIDRDIRQADQYDKTNQLFLKNMQTSGYTFDKDGNIVPKRAYGGKMRKYKKC